jgi:3-oxoacyl-(acyl-carrier-protein) synthase
MQKNKVVITAMSVCAPNGIGNHAFQQNVANGISGCDYITNFEIPKNCGSAAGIIKDFYPETHFSFSKANDSDFFLERQNKIAQFCMDEVLSIAQLKKINGKFAENIDLFLATAIGSMISMEYGFIRRNIQDVSVNKEILKAFSFRNFTEKLSQQFALNGKNITIPTGCVGGCDAISYAFNLIRLGKTKCAIVGAIEAPITPLVVSAFGQINATSTRNCSPQEASSPFDLMRDGFVLGEGGGLFVLENEQYALNRGANIIAEIKGSGSYNNCFHMTDISSDGKHIEKSCWLALKDAGLNPDDIDYINAHGSSTVQNDIAESRAFSRIFGERICDIPVTSLKSQNGHALAAASAIEIVSAIQTLQSQIVPPTLNLKKLDPLCNINVVTQANQKYNVINFLKTSSGFSGIHTALVIGKYEENK